MNTQLPENKPVEGNTEGSTDDKTLQNMDKTGFDTLIALLECHTKTAAAIQLGIDRSTLYDRIDKYQLDKVIDTIPQKALQTLKLGSERAAEVLVEGLDDRREKYANAERVLDRVGLTGGGPKTLQQFNVNGEMSVEFVGPDDKV